MDICKFTETIISIKVLKYFFVFIFYSLLLSCTQEPIESREQLEVITLVEYDLNNKVYVGGKILSDGGSPIIEKGIHDQHAFFHPPINYKYKYFYKMGSGPGEYKMEASYSNNPVHVVAYAINYVDTAYGDVVMYENKKPPTPRILQPKIKTLDPSNITGSTVNLNGLVESNGYYGYEVDSFLLNKGFYLGTCPKPEKFGEKISLELNDTSFSIKVADLFIDSTYYFKAYAENEKWIVIGEEKAFNLAKASDQCIGCESGTFIDARDSMEYNWTKIGNQYWMAENLAYLPNKWKGLGLSYYFFVYGYEGSDLSEAISNSNFKNYGVLYNWSATMSDSIHHFVHKSNNDNPSKIKGACPTGWHIPSSAEWDILANILGGSSIAGSKLKKQDGASLSYVWNKGATNESGFSALPGGLYNRSGGIDNYFAGVYKLGKWWSSTVFDELHSSNTVGDSSHHSNFSIRTRMLDSNDNCLNSQGETASEKENGTFAGGSDRFYSVRCLKD